MNSTKRLRLRSGVIEWKEVEGEVVAVDLDSGNYLATNRAGALLWIALAKGATLAELIALLVDRFDVPSGEAEADIAAFLAELADQNLLDERP